MPCAADRRLGQSVPWVSEVIEAEYGAVVTTEAEDGRCASKCVAKSPSAKLSGFFLPRILVVEGVRRGKLAL